MIDKEILEAFQNKVDWEGDLIYTLRNWYNPLIVTGPQLPMRLRKSARDLVNAFLSFKEDLQAAYDDEGIEHL